MGTPLITSATSVKLWIPFQDGTGNPTVTSIPGATMSTITPSGNPKWENGIIGKSLAYDSAADTKQFITTDLYRGTGNIAGYCLVKVPSTIPTNSGVLWHDRTTTNNNCFAIRIASSVGRMSAVLGDNTGGNTQPVIATDLRGEWAFVGFSIDATAKTVSIYANGGYVTSTALSGALLNGNNPLIIAKDTLGTTYLSGSLSHMIVRNTVITQKEFNTAYQSIKGRFLL